MRKRRIAVAIALPLVATVGFAGLLVREELERRAMPSRHGSAVVAVAFSPDGELVLSADGNGGLFLWRSHDLEDSPGHAVRILTVKDVRSHEIAFTPDGHGAIVGYVDGTILHWDLESASRRTLRSGGWPLSGLAVSSDGRQVLSGHSDSTLLTPRGSPFGALELRDIRTGALVWKRETLRVRSLAWSPDQRNAAVVHYRSLRVGIMEDTVSIIDMPRGGVETCRLDGFAALAFSCDGRWLTAVSDRIRVYDSVTGATVNDYNPEGRYYSARTTRRGLELFGYNQLTTFALPTLTPLRSQKVWTTETPTSWSISPSGDRFVAGLETGEVLVIPLRQPD